MHGNEPSGVIAAERVLSNLNRSGISVRGRVVALRGNLQALESKTRFVERDLNRMWLTTELDLLLSTDRHCDSPEEREQRDLLTVIRKAVETGGNPVFFMDMHSASAAGPPFCLISDTLQNRELAFSFGIPVILGLEEALDGTTLNYFGRLGYIAVGIEGGQHDDPETIDHLERIIWNGMIKAGIIGASYRLDDLKKSREKRFKERSLPSVVEVYHRHGILPNDHFQMMRGLRNFTPVVRGQIMAHDREGAIHAPGKGFVLLPLYQAQGDDGFFLGRSVRPFWLSVSTILRKIRAERLLTLLPGVSKHPILPFTLRADPRIARWFMVEIFHLMGYRKARSEGGVRLFTRRPEHRNDGR